MTYSPLRYPGGKTKIAPLIKLILKNTSSKDVTYIEPFAGGAGVALSLLLEGLVERIIINDYDFAIYSFWRSILEYTEDFIGLIHDTPLTIEEWYNQKEIYLNQNNDFSLKLGFATFYLNRTNRSGILAAGPIGGKNQDSEYKLSERFNREGLISRIKKIAQYSSKIEVHNLEIRSFIDQVMPNYKQNAFVYFDPPYYNKGQNLYKNFLTPSDHKEIADYIKNSINCDWIITYDDVDHLKEFYSGYSIKKFSLNYTAGRKVKGSEIIIFKSPNLMPNEEDILSHPKIFRLFK